MIRALVLVRLIFLFLFGQSLAPFGRWLIAFSMGVACLFFVSATLATSKRRRIERALARRLLHKIRRGATLLKWEYHALMRYQAREILVQTGRLRATGDKIKHFIYLPWVKNVRCGEWIPELKLA